MHTSLLFAAALFLYANTQWLHVWAEKGDKRMSHYYARIQGNRGEATRQGTKASGIRATVETWDYVVTSRISYLAGADHLEVDIRTKGGQLVKRLVSGHLDERSTLLESDIRDYTTLWVHCDHEGVLFIEDEFDIRDDVLFHNGTWGTHFAREEDRESFNSVIPGEVPGWVNTGNVPHPVKEDK